MLHYRQSRRQLRIEKVGFQPMAFAGHFDGHFSKFFEDREQDSMRDFLAGIRDCACRESKDAFGERVELVDGSVDYGSCGMMKRHAGHL